MNNIGSKLCLTKDAYEKIGYVHTVPDGETERRRKCTG